MSDPHPDGNMDSDSGKNIQQPDRGSSADDGTESDCSDVIVSSRSRQNVLEDSDSEASRSSDEGSGDSESESGDEENDAESGVEEDGEASNDEDGSSSEDNESECETTAPAEVPGSESDSSSDGQADRCPICLSRFTRQTIGTPENCEHTFCLECIMEWAKNMNTCPVDRKNFTMVFVRKLLNGQVVDKIPITNGRQATVDEDGDLTCCEVCRLSDREDRLLLCDGCDSGYHLECLTPPLVAVPVEEWFCAICARQNGYSEDRFIPEDRYGRPVTPHLPNSFTRMVPRTRASELVRRRIQRTRTLLMSVSQPSTSGIESAANSPRTNRVRRRRGTTRRPRRKTKGTATKRKRKSGTKRKRKTKSSTKTRKTRKTKTGRRRRRKRRSGKQCKYKQPKPIITPKHRIAQHLGLKKPIQGTTVPSVRGRPERSILHDRSDVGISSLSLFGDRNELVDLADGFDDNGPMAVQSRVAAPRNLTHRKTLTASALLSHRSVQAATRRSFISPESIEVPTTSQSATFDLLGSIMNGQNMLRSTDVLINRDGSLMKRHLQVPSSRQKPSEPTSGSTDQGTTNTGCGGTVGGSGQRDSWSTSARSESDGNSRALSGNSGEADGGSGRAFQGRDRSGGDETFSRDVVPPNERNCDRRNERERKATEDDDIDIYSDIETGFEPENEDDACDSRMDLQPPARTPDFGTVNPATPMDYDDASSEGDLVIDETVKPDMDFEQETPSGVVDSSKEGSADSSDNTSYREDANEAEGAAGDTLESQPSPEAENMDENQQSPQRGNTDENTGDVGNDSGGMELISASEDSCSAHSKDQQGDEEWHSPDDKECHSADDKECHSPDDKECHSPDDKECHSPDDKECHSPDDKECHSPDDKEIKSQENDAKGSNEEEEDVDEEEEDEAEEEEEEEEVVEKDNAVVTNPEESVADEEEAQNQDPLSAVESPEQEFATSPESVENTREEEEEEEEDEEAEEEEEDKEEISEPEKISEPTEGNEGESEGEGEEAAVAEEDESPEPDEKVDEADSPKKEDVTAPITDVTPVSPEEPDIVEVAFVEASKSTVGRRPFRRRIVRVPSKSPEKRKKPPLPATAHGAKRGTEYEEGEIGDGKIHRSASIRKQHHLAYLGSKQRARHENSVEYYAGPRVNMADLPRIPKLKRTDDESRGNNKDGEHVAPNSGGEASGTAEVSWKKLSQNSKSRNYRDGKPKDERRYFREKEEAVIAAAAAAKKDSHRGRESERQQSGSRGRKSENLPSREKQRPRNRGWDSGQSSDWHDKAQHRRDKEKDRDSDSRHRTKRKVSRSEKDGREKHSRRSSNSRTHESDAVPEKSSNRDHDRNWDRSKSDRDKRKDKDRDKDRERKEKPSAPIQSSSRKEKQQEPEKPAASHSSSTAYRDNKHRHRKRKEPKEKPEREKTPERIPVPMPIVKSPTPEPYLSGEASPIESKEVYASGDSIIVNVNFSRPNKEVAAPAAEPVTTNAVGPAKTKTKESPAKRAIQPLQFPPTPPEPLLQVVPFQGIKKRAGSYDNQSREGPKKQRADRMESVSEERSWCGSTFSGGEEDPLSPSCDRSDDDAARDGPSDRKEIIDISSDDSNQKPDGGDVMSEAHSGAKNMDAEDNAGSNTDDNANDSGKESGSEDDGDEVDIAYDPFEPTRSPSLPSSDGASANASQDVHDNPAPSEALKPEPPPLSDLPPLPPEPEPESLPMAPVSMAASFTPREPPAVVSSPASVTPLQMGSMAHRVLLQMPQTTNTVPTLQGPPMQQQHSTMQLAATMQLPNVRVPPPNFLPRAMQNSPAGAAAAIAAAAQMNALRPLGPWAAAAAAAAAAVAGGGPNLLFPPSRPLLRGGLLQSQLPGVNIPAQSHSVTLTQIGNLLHSQAAQLAMLTGVRVGPPPLHLNLQNPPSNLAAHQQQMNSAHEHLTSLQQRGNFDGQVGMHTLASANGDTRRHGGQIPPNAQRQSQHDVTEVVDMDVDSPYSPADADYLSDNHSEQSDHRPAGGSSHSAGPLKDRFDILLGSAQNRKENVPAKTAHGSAGSAQSSGRVKGSDMRATASGRHHHHTHHQGASRGDNHRSKRKSESRKHILRMEVKTTVRKDKMDSAGRKEGLKADDAHFTILDELPSSAVEMQVKEKFLKKLNRQERVVEEVKLAIKPYYNRREINKDEYKEILRKSVPKICHNRSGEINPLKIKSLVEGYVKMFKHQRKKDGKPGKK